METASFGASTAAGLFVGTKVMTLGAGLAIAAGPVGWVILIGVGLAAGYGAAKFGDETFRIISSSIYDRNLGSNK